MTQSLALSRHDIAAALFTLSRSPKLALGFDASALSAFGSSEPAWVPKAGERLPSKRGAYTVIAVKTLLPGLAWPWLLCSEPRHSTASPAASRAASGPLSRISRLCFVSAAALCLRPGHSREPVNEQGERLRLVPPERLARATAPRPGSAAPSSLSERLGFSRSARLRSKLPLRPEISSELASLLRF